MNKSPEEARAFGQDLSRAGLPEGVRALLFPTALALEHLVATVPSTVGVGVQNAHPEVCGAFTGEISAAMAKEAGASWGLAGHSERRELFGECDALAAERVSGLLRAGLNVMFCVGERMEDRERGLTDRVLRRQLGALKEEDLAHQRLSVAYEPVWAIGSGKAAGPKEATEAVLMIQEFARRPLTVLYGGSVNPTNVERYFQSGELGGVLVGGASLNPQTFRELLVAVAL